MLRLTTKVAVSPASSVRSWSAAMRISSITSGRVSANSAVSSSSVSALPSRPLWIAACASSGPISRSERRPEPRRGMKLQYLSLTTSSTPCSVHSGSRYCGEAPEVGRAGVDELVPPVGEVGWDLDADPRHQAPALGDEELHLLDRDLARPARHRLLARERRAVARPALACRLVRDLRDLAPVVARVRDEVLEDHLLDVAVALVKAGERLERGHALLLALADPDQDPGRERDLELTGGLDRLEPAGRVLGRRALVDDEVRVDRLEHQPLRGGHLPQARQVLALEDAEVRVRKQASLERPLAGPGDVGDEVGVSVGAKPRGDLRVHLRPLAGEHEELLGVTPDRLLEPLLHLLRRVEVRPVRGERAVLAVAATRTRQRERVVAREGDAPHALKLPKRRRATCSGRAPRRP